jgi:hypothetical protein
MNLAEIMADAAFSVLPREGRPPESGRVSEQVIATHRDVNKFGDESVRVIGRVAESRFADFARHLCRRIANAGPVVLDLTVKVRPHAAGSKIVFETPLIPARTYGDVIHRQELAMPPLYRPSEPAPEKPSAWERFKRAAVKFAEPIPYDGPRGWRDA